jgi:hypothetical protein
VEDSLIEANGSGGIYLNKGGFSSMSATILNNTIRDHVDGIGVQCASSIGSIDLDCTGNSFSGNMEDVGGSCGTTCL